jgi:RND family efflux transporter MFP subunit
MESIKPIGGANESARNQDAVHAETMPKPTTVRRSWRRRAMALALAALAFGSIWVLEVIPRKQARADLNKETIDLSVPAVSVLKPKTGSQAQEIVLPGNLQAFKDTPVYARTNGYLKRWYTDIGTHVKAGQLLAEIETPEVDDQLKQARADRATAEANYELAKVTAARWQELLKTDAVARQATDQTVSDFHAREAMLQSARFNEARLEKLAAFERVYAPFDGVITARNTDVGALINAGSTGGPVTELFHMADTRRLRVYVFVPQVYAQEALPGIPADLTLAERPGERFTGSLVRSTETIDPTSRTLQVEIDVDNPTGELFPGAYAQVHLSFQAAQPTLIVPVNTLLFRPEGVEVAVVGADQRVKLEKIVLGRDFGTEVEVVAGLQADQTLVLNPSDSITDGQPVRVVKDTAAQAAK